MENENKYLFREVNGQLITVTEQNTRITYTVTRERRILKLKITYTRVQFFKTIRARVVYALYNNRVARFKRALLPTVTHALNTHGIRISML